MEDTTVAFEKFQEYLEHRMVYDRKARGEIIYAAVSLESTIEQIIAEHFSASDAKALFISLMFMTGQITFSQKIQILKKLFKDSYPDLLTTFPNMFNGLEKVRELRNKLAHSKESYGEPDIMALMEGRIAELPKGTFLEYFKDGELRTEFISEEKVKQILKLSQVYHMVLDYIAMEVKNRRRGLNNINFQIVLRNLRRDSPELFTLNHKR